MGNTMKATKWILLSGAAMTVMATTARADDLSALKAEIEALQSRVSQLEAQPQGAMPSGYSLMAIRDGQGTYEGVLPERYADRVRESSGFTLSVLPTADAAPAAEVSVSGEIRTALIYTDESTEIDLSFGGLSASDEFGDDNLDLKVRGRIFIKGKADTAVGEVGGYFRLQADGGGNLSDYSEATKMNKAYGWWKFAPNWEFMAGYNDNTAALQVGWDWMAATGPVKSFGPSNINNEQMRLTYASGPFSFGIALEDPDAESFTFLTDGPDPDAFADDIVTITGSPDRSDLPALEAYLMYSSDSFTAQVVGLVQDDNFGDDLDWAIGGGANVGISDGFQITAAAVFAEGTTQYANNLAPATPDDEFFAASVGIIASLSEDTRIELGAGYEENDGGDFFPGAEALGFGGGVYWDPVSQVTLGVGATYVEIDFDDFDTTLAGEPFSLDIEQDSLEIFFSTWLRFP
jgi:hypothetical protein